MAAARRRGEVAVGIFPEERKLVWLNPPREAPVPATEETAIVVLAQERSS